MRINFTLERSYRGHRPIRPGLEAIKLEFMLRLQIKRNDLRLYSSFITSRPGVKLQTKSVETRLHQSGKPCDAEVLYSG